MYKLLNTKWGDPTFGTPSGTINWQDNLSGLPTASGTNTSALVGALEAAFDKWESVASVNFAEGGDIDVQITYANFRTDSDATNNGAAATAAWSLGDSGSLEPQNAVITFNSDETWAPYGSGGVDFYAVALHEIGHILGLGHPTPEGNFPGEVMNSVISASDLGSGDITGAQLIYGSDKGDTSPEETAVRGGGDEDDGGSAGVGLIAGLLALILGIFSGGAGAAAFLAAAKVADTDDEEDSDGPGDTVLNGVACPLCGGLACEGHTHDGHEHIETVLADGSVQVMHVTPLPMIEIDDDSFQRGTDDEDNDQEFLLI